MQQQISYHTLCAYFSQLRQMLMQWEKEKERNVVFLNNRAWYAYMAQKDCGGKTVAQILEDMRCCMPLALTKDSMCRLFHSGAEISAFAESSKADFLMLLRYAKADECLWQSLLELCEGLRRRTVWA